MVIPRWFKNKVEIFHGHKHNFIQDGTIQKLQINRIGLEDAGRYTCQCNDISTTAWLYVEGKNGGRAPNMIQGTGITS